MGTTAHAFSLSLKVFMNTRELEKEVPVSLPRTWAIGIVGFRKTSASFEAYRLLYCSEEMVESKNETYLFDMEDIPVTGQVCQ